MTETIRGFPTNSELSQTLFKHSTYNSNTSSPLTWKQTLTMMTFEEIYECEFPRPFIFVVNILVVIFYWKSTDMFVHNREVSEYL